MRNLSAEEKAFIWLDAFPLPLSEKNALLKAAGSAVTLVKNYAEFFKNAVKADESGVYNDMAQSLKDDSFFKNVIDRKSTRLNSSHTDSSRMPSSA